ncbi:MAG: hypothetical protein AB1725_01165 [Armatimonadota bacterium]
MKTLTFLLAVALIGMTVGSLGCGKSDEVADPTKDAAPAKPGDSGSAQAGEFAEAELPQSGDGGGAGGTGN